jgi:hypothetical protein
VVRDEIQALVPVRVGCEIVEERLHPPRVHIHERGPAHLEPVGAREVAVDRVDRLVEGHIEAVEIVGLQRRLVRRGSPPAFHSVEVPVRLVEHLDVPNPGVLLLQAAEDQLDQRLEIFERPPTLDEVRRIQVHQHRIRHRARVPQVGVDLRREVARAGREVALVEDVLLVGGVGAAEPHPVDVAVEALLVEERDVVRTLVRPRRDVAEVVVPLWPRQLTLPRTEVNRDRRRRRRRLTRLSRSRLHAGEGKYRYDRSGQCGPKSCDHHSPYS